MNEIRKVGSVYSGHDAGALLGVGEGEVSWLIVAALELLVVDWLAPVEDCLWIALCTALGFSWVRKLRVMAAIANNIRTTTAVAIAHLFNVGDGNVSAVGPVESML